MADLLSETTVRLSDSERQQGHPAQLMGLRYTDPGLYPGRMRDMLRNEIRFASAPDGVPFNLPLKTHTPGPPSLFGAGELTEIRRRPMREHR